MKPYYAEAPKQTRELAEKVAQWTEEQKLDSALVIALTGDLGSGKTTFVQNLAASLKVQEKVLSPTFVILKKFNLPQGKFTTFYHIDCYRLEQPEELLNLGFEEIVQDPENLVVIEWADKVKEILPEHYLEIHFEVEGKQKRKIKINSK